MNNGKLTQRPCFDKALKAVIPVNINVSMSVLDILKIEEVDHIYILKFRLVLEWYTKSLKANLV